MTVLLIEQNLKALQQDVLVLQAYENLFDDFVPQVVKNAWILWTLEAENLFWQASLVLKLVNDHLIYVQYELMFWKGQHFASVEGLGDSSYE